MNFKSLYENHQQKVYYFILKRVSNVADAEDLTSIVFEKIYKKLPDFQWQGVSIESWIFTIARNAIIDFHRKNSKYRGNVDIDNLQVESEDSDKELLTGLLDDESIRSLYLAMSNLDSDDQYLVYYKYFEELSNSEIAERTGLSETNVGTKLYRLRKKLIKIIAKNND